MADEPDDQRARSAAAAASAFPRDIIAEPLRTLRPNAAREPLPQAMQALLARLAREDRR